MEIVTEYDEQDNVVKDYIVDEYGNINIYHISEELAKDKSLNVGKLFNGVEASYRMELKMNKELYEQGIISNELYTKVESIILSKLRFFDNRIKV